MLLNFQRGDWLTIEAFEKNLIIIPAWPAPSCIITSKLSYIVESLLIDCWEVTAITTIYLQVDYSFWYLSLKMLKKLIMTEKRAVKMLCIRKAVCVNSRSVTDWLKVLHGAWLAGSPSESAWLRRHLPPPSLRIWVRGATHCKERTDSHSASSDTRLSTVACASLRVCPQQCGQNT